MQVRKRDQIHPKPRPPTVNRAAEEILGQEAKNLEGHTISRTGLFTPSYWQRFTDQPELGTQRNELTLQSGDETRFIGFSINPNA